MDDTFKPTKKKLIASLVFLSCIIVALWLGETIDGIMNSQVYAAMSSHAENGNSTNKVEDGAKALEAIATSITEEQKNKVKEVYYQFFIIKWITYAVLSYLAACLLLKRVGSKEVS